MSEAVGPRRVAFALGGNLGDRLAHLQAALDGLARTPGVAVRAVSAVYETDPVGGPGDSPDYFNAVVVVDSDLPPLALLHRGLELEAGEGRVRRERWGPRTLDVDLLACGDEAWRDEELTLPHPRAAERAFVLVPWHDADPAAELPAAGPVAVLLDKLEPSELAGVRRRDDVSLRW